MQDKKHLISVARGEQKADLVLKGGRILNVFTGELEEGDLAICDGVIAGIGHQDDMVAGIGQYEGLEELDVSGKILCPGRRRRACWAREQASRRHCRRP